VYVLYQQNYLENVLNKFDIQKYKIVNNMIPEEKEEFNGKI
jgi:hypothetical protein